MHKLHDTTGRNVLVMVGLVMAVAYLPIAVGQ